MARCEVAIVHDYLTQRGGAERVVLSMLRMFPDAPLYTALYEPDSTYPEFAQYDVRPLLTNRLATLRHNHRRGLLLYPFVFARLQVDANLVLCSSSGFAHGIRTIGLKIVYCYTPARWLYDEAETYLATWPKAVRAVIFALAPVLRRWDQQAARTADAYLTSSIGVQNRILRVYKRDSTVVAPAIRSMSHASTEPVPSIDSGFLLCVSRLLAYKNVESVARAFAELPGYELVIVGAGPERDNIMSAAGSNVTVLGRVDDAQLAWLYSTCVGVIGAAHEDFGLTTLEAASVGKPVATLRSGGYLDTVIEGRTGLFFDRPDPVSIASAVRQLVDLKWDKALIEQHSATFCESAFARRLQEAVATISDGAGVKHPNGLAA